MISILKQRSTQTLFTWLPFMVVLMGANVSVCWRGEREEDRCSERDGEKDRTRERQTHTHTHTHREKEMNI